jgi:hypothetical protein
VSKQQRVPIARTDLHGSPVRCRRAAA